MAASGRHGALDWSRLQWRLVRGRVDDCMYEELNEADRDLLHFLSTNEATVCNTWFQRGESTSRNGSTPSHACGTV